MFDHQNHRRPLGNESATNRKIIQGVPLTSVFFASFNLGVTKSIHWFHHRSRKNIPISAIAQRSLGAHASRHSGNWGQRHLRTLKTQISAIWKIWKIWKSQESQQQIWQHLVYLIIPNHTYTNLDQAIHKTSKLTRPCLAAQDRWHYPGIPGALNAETQKAVAICSKQSFWKVSVDVSNRPSTHWADLCSRIRGIAKKLGGVVQGETFKRLQRMSIPPKQISLYKHVRASLLLIVSRLNAYF